MERNRYRGNPRQQPSRRHYTRERDRYYEDELRDVYGGADYNERARHQRDDFIPHDYYDDNYRFTPYDRQRSYSEYAPAVDYGYDRDEYYPLDPAHDHYRRSAATGYGNDNSLQARDFDDWRETASRHRNWEPRDFSAHQFPGQRRREHNNDFEAGLYDYRAGHQYQDRFRGKTIEDQWPRRRGAARDRAEERRLHNRSDRHLEIVTPFKEDRYYGRNDYNSSSGFGSNEFVFHNDGRDAFDEGGSMVD